MSAYLSVRGWLDFVAEQRDAVRAILQRHDDGFYSRGWTEVNGPNGDSCLVYCGTIRESGAEWLLEQLQELAAVPAPAGDPEDVVRGLLFVHHEVSGMQEWQVRDGRVKAEPLPGRYDYLQE